MKKRIIVITALLIAVIVGIVAFSAGAKDYKTGSYTVTREGGLNVRRGAGVPYALLGMADEGATFIVSQVDGSWGYTSSVRCKDGVTRAGWLRISYCKYNDGNRSTYNDVIATSNTSGYTLENAVASQSEIFTEGEFVYIWGYLHDGNGNMFNSYSTGSCDMTLSVFRPDGSCAYTSTTADSDSNWIGQRLDAAGEWTIQSKVEGSLTGNNTRVITVRENGNNFTLTYNANGGKGAVSSQKAQANTEVYLSASVPVRAGYTFVGWNTDRDAKSALYQPSDKIEIEADTTLYAIWKKTSSSASKLTLNDKSAELKVNGVKRLKATLSPKNAQDGDITWQSEDSAIATVDKRGKVIARKPGVVIITASTEGGLTAECEITVKGIVIDGEDGFNTPVVGEKIQLEAVVYPDESDKLSWSSSNTRVLSVNSDGTVTAKKSGKATVTVKCGALKSKAVITVSDAVESKTGSFDSKHGGADIALMRGADCGYLCIYTYNAYGERTNGDMTVTLRDSEGAVLYKADVSSGEKLRISGDSGAVSLRIEARRGALHNAPNSARCNKWLVSCIGGCHITG